VTHRCPALLVAAPASGQGKTTVTAALARRHRRAGRRVRVFKCGPDFLDPQILAAASGAPVENLDLWMCGADDGARRLYNAAADADLILVEGVMGLYDGAPSSADIAHHFGLPVLAVIDAAAMAQTFGALAQGLAVYRPGIALTGVLANGVGSAHHAALLEQSLPPGIAWYGALARGADNNLPERHLGLLQAQEIADLDARLDRLADTLPAAANTLPPAVSFPGALVAPGEPPPRLLDGVRVAVARDAAFGFIYPANVDTLTALGARTVFFSPLADQPIPDADALWLPGGYPELHAARLAGNRTFLDSLRAHHRVSKPLLAECGGLLVLLDGLTDLAGTAHRMAGLLPGTAVMQPRLAALGPQQMALPEGLLRGHTFHHSRTDTPLPPTLHATTPEGRPGEAVYRAGRLTASYVHAYFPSDPAAVAALFAP
jgi:cobyrinic acid a,c-diamide synthase